MENLRLFEIDAENFHAEKKVSGYTASDTNSPALSPQSLSSLLINIKMSDEKVVTNSNDSHQALVELLASPAVAHLLEAGKNLAFEQEARPEDALKQILVTLRTIDALWGQVLLKEGLANLSSQYH